MSYTPYTFVTLVPDLAPESSTNIDGTGSAAVVKAIKVASDRGGNIYIADGMSLIRKLTPKGEVTTIAGLADCWGSDDGIGRAARFALPKGIAVDSAGDIYVGDALNQTVRKLTRSWYVWQVSTFAGMACTCGYSDGTGCNARFNAPSGMATDTDGNIYVADSGSHTIRKITPEGAVTTLAGLAGTRGTADGTGEAARFWNPVDVAVDHDGDVYVADQGNHAIRKVSPDGSVTTLAGTPGYYGFYDGTVSDARFNGPSGIALDTHRNVYVADTGNHTIRKVTPQGVVTTAAGLAGIPGTIDGVGSAARFKSPAGLTVTPSGAIYVADAGNGPIRKLTEQGNTWAVSTVAGKPAQVTSGSSDGRATHARLNHPFDVAIDKSGNSYISDYENHTIRKISPAGFVNTLAGSPGIPGREDGIGDAAHFCHPAGIAVDANNNVYVADNGNCTIRRITPEGNVTTLAGKAGEQGCWDGTGTGARFDEPLDLAVSPGGALFVSDWGSHTIRKVTQAGVVTTVAGSPYKFGSDDGTGREARFSRPYGVAVDGKSNVYIVDQNNCTIRKMTPDGAVSTIAGTPGSYGASDGSGRVVRFNNPRFLAIDSRGDLYLTDWNVLRKVTRSFVPRDQPLPRVPDDPRVERTEGEVETWTVTSLAGFPGADTDRDGTGREALFAAPLGIAVDAAGNVYVTGSTGNNLRKGVPAISVPWPTLESPGITADCCGFTITGPEGLWVKIESSVDLSSWKVEGTCKLQNGIGCFTSPYSAQNGPKYFRASVR